jgi:hypothetical protein
VSSVIRGFGREEPLAMNRYGGATERA